VKAPVHPIKGAGGIVFNALGKVLLLRHKEGTWVFPKGHIDPGESSLQAAMREVEEEAGIAVRCADPELELATEYVNDRRQKRRIRWFILRSDAEAPTCPESLFPEGGFFSPGEALELLTFEEDRQLLREALELVETKAS
jgi:diadenosine hexaphosphate hydrolase (ATP-forming)